MNARKTVLLFHEGKGLPLGIQDACNKLGHTTCINKMSNNLSDLSLVAEHRIVTVPTVIVLDAQGSTLARRTGPEVTPAGIDQVFAALSQ